MPSHVCVSVCVTHLSRTLSSQMQTCNQRYRKPHDNTYRWVLKARCMVTLHASVCAYVSLSVSVCVRVIKEMRDVCKRVCVCVCVRVQAFEIRKACLGVNHPDTVATLSGAIVQLINSSFTRSQLAKAEPMCSLAVKCSMAMKQQADLGCVRVCVCVCPAS